MADLEEVWLNHVLKLIPNRLKLKFPASIESLAGEMREDYSFSVKKAIGMYFANAS